MDKDRAASAVQKDQKDGFSQLAEKMEQVRTQMVNMERKYDELYRTVKEKEFRSSSDHNREASEDARSARESLIEPSARTSVTADVGNKSEKSAEDNEKTKNNLDAKIEKMEDNPFV